MNRRVVITGVGLTCPIGSDKESVRGALERGEHGIKQMDEWDSVRNMNTRLAAPATVVLDYPRKKIRTMGRLAQLATFATEQAIGDAGLDEALVRSPRTGLAYGSTHGSTAAMESFCRTWFANDGLLGVPGTEYLKFMSHTCAANLAQTLGIVGRVVPTTSACVSGSQAIGVGAETVRYGLQDRMICGGAEELHFVHAGVFDILNAASHKYNKEPSRSPRPFDADRDGLVVGEGAGAVVLEEYEAARRRGARIYGEVLGYGTNCDGTHVTSPSAVGMAGAMQLALEEAGVPAAAIDYINAHGTATALGDVAESQATLRVLGERIPISSTKGHTGHTLGACGAIEAIFCLLAMESGFVPQTRNLERPDPNCAALDFVMGEPRRMSVDTVMSNNFAFGGINTSLVLKKV